MAKGHRTEWKIFDRLKFIEKMEFYFSLKNRNYFLDNSIVQSDWIGLVGWRNPYKFSYLRLCKKTRRGACAGTVFVCPSRAQSHSFPVIKQILTARRLHVHSEVYYLNFAITRKPVCLGFLLRGEILTGSAGGGRHRTRTRTNHRASEP